MTDLGIIFRFITALIGALVIALVVLPIHLAFETLKVLGEEVARVRRNW